MGEPDRYGVVGYPIKHSRSPFIHRHFASASAQRLAYSAYEVVPADFSAWVKDFFAAGGRGLNVTVPHKEAALTVADHLSDRAREAGAVNTLACRPDGSVFGDNTDGAGWIADLTIRDVELRGRDVLILGAGGATRGILAPLMAQRPARIIIANRHLERARALVDRFARAAATSGTTLETMALQALADPDGAAKSSVDLLVQATSVGLEGGTPAVSNSLISVRTVACDLAYGAAADPFCRWARTAGAAQVFDGTGMLIEQAAESFRLWRGLRPDTRALRKELIG